MSGEDLGSCWICGSEETVYMDVIACSWCEDCFDKEYRSGTTHESR